LEGYEDERPVLSMLVIPPALTAFTGTHFNVKDEGAVPVADVLETMQIGRVLYVHPDTSITRNFWPWGAGTARNPHHSHDRLEQCIRFERAFVEAVGHRLSSLSEPSGLPRHERRAIERTQAPYRILDLRSPDRPTASGDHHSVNWSHRWMVRGHWRNQAYGHGYELRRLTWIDPYIKGSENLPLDVRPDLFKL
jgi:hypothetical protein